jgi:multidrug resistance efflux pump
MKNLYQFTFLTLFSLMFLLSCGSKKEDIDKAGQDETSTAPADSLGLNDKVLGVARVEPISGVTNISAGESGKIIDVLVEDNQIIKQGQTLFILDTQIEEAQLKQTKSTYESQKLEITANKIALNAVNTKAQNIKNKLERAEAQYAGKAITENELVNIQYEWKEIADEKSKAQNMISQSESRLREIQAEINYQQTLIAKKTIKAPLSGLVLKTMVKKGNYLTAQSEVIELAIEGPLIAKTEVDELFAEQIKKQQKAEIFSQTSGEKLGSGAVVFVSEYLKTKSLFRDQSTELEDRRVREVHILLDNPQGLIIGGRVDCVINLK